jgi:hypothetical protein
VAEQQEHMTFVHSGSGKQRGSLIVECSCSLRPLGVVDGGDKKREAAAVIEGQHVRSAR